MGAVKEEGPHTGKDFTVVMPLVLEEEGQILACPSHLSKRRGTGNSRLLFVLLLLI